jgi:hypothetical protein
MLALFQEVLVVLVFVAGEDAVNAGADHGVEGLLDKFGVAVLGGGVGEGPSEPEAFVELADGEQPGVAG